VPVDGPDGQVERVERMEWLKVVKKSGGLARKERDGDGAIPNRQARACLPNRVRQVWPVLDSVRDLARFGNEDHKITPKCGRGSLVFWRENGFE
jgi:hypothetical protein